MATNPIGGSGTPPPINNQVIDKEKEEETKDEAREKKGFVLGGNNVGRAANDNVPKKKSIFERAGKINNIDNNASVRPQTDGESEGDS